MNYIDNINNKMNETLKFYGYSIASIASSVITLSDVAVWFEITAGITAVLTGLLAARKYIRGRDLDKYQIENEKLLKEIREQQLYQLMNKNKHNNEKEE